MRKAVSILEQITVHLPEIKLALGERWPIFADQMRAQAPSFENLADEAALEKAANQLLSLFVANDAIVEVMTRPVAEETRRVRLANIRHYLDRQEPASQIDLETIANRFYLLCQNPDQAADPSQPEATLKDSAANSEKEV